MNDQHNQACKATWGYLAPKENEQYEGEIIFAEGCYSDMVTISWKFKGLNDSPWFYECLHDFLLVCNTEAGHIYKFTGTFCNYKFEGELEELEYGNKKD